jgi:hypothetical protein
VPCIISEIRKGRLHCFGHEERMPGEKMVRNRPIPKGKSSGGKSRKRCLGDVENDPKKMGVRGWRKIARERERLEIDPAGDQGFARTVESEEKWRKIQTR